MNDWLKTFFKNAQSEIAAVVILMAADLLFLYKALPVFPVFASDPARFYSLIFLSQFVVLLVVSRLFFLSLQKTLFEQKLQFEKTLFEHQQQFEKTLYEHQQQFEKTLYEHRRLLLSLGMTSKNQQKTEPEQE